MRMKELSVARRWMMIALSFILCSLSFSVAHAQSMNISVDSVGKLEKQLPDDIRFKVAELKVSGPLNGADLKLLSQIVTRTKVNKKVVGECLVTSIDLSEAVIKEGKEGMKTENNTLPNGLFSGATSLVKALLPKNILNISRNCFDNCSSLAEMPIPETVITIGSNAFSDCPRLSTFDLPNVLTEIEHDAFEGCISLTAIQSPESVLELGDNAFKGCKSLSKVVINGKIKEIGISTFQDCRVL